MAEAEVRDALNAGYAAGLQAATLMTQVVDPVSGVVILGNLGEWLLYRGEPAESGALLRSSLDLARLRDLPAHGWRLQASMAGWLVAAGEPAVALAKMQALLLTLGDHAPQQTAARTNLSPTWPVERWRSRPRRGSISRWWSGWSTAVRLPSCGAQSALFVTRAEVPHAQWRAEQTRLDASLQRDRATEFSASA